MEMWTALLILHGLMAVALLGALTHQALSVWWPVRARTGAFLNDVRAVSSGSYSHAIIVLFVVTAILGGIIYPAYRLGIRPTLQDYRMFKAEGAFELKEHFIAIGLGMLPAYWHFWHKPLAAEDARTRAILTGILAFVVWFSFLVGHVLNNIRGFGS
jgi:hypothetical protein